MQLGDGQSSKPSLRNEELPGASYPKGQRQAPPGRNTSAGLWMDLQTDHRMPAPSGLDAVHHGHTDVENYQIELSSLTFSNVCSPFSASSQIPRESLVKRNRIPRRIASWSL